MGRPSEETSPWHLALIKNDAGKGADVIMLMPLCASLGTTTKRVDPALFVASSKGNDNKWMGGGGHPELGFM